MPNSYPKFGAGGWRYFSKPSLNGFDLPSDTPAEAEVT